jgi:hypothetical protein
MGFEANSVRAASVLAAAGTAWPSGLCFLTDLAASPYERAVSAAWCGAGSPALEFLGHCPACWTGAAAFIFASIMVLASGRLGWARALNRAERE